MKKRKNLYLIWRNICLLLEHHSLLHVLCTYKCMDFNAIFSRMKDEEQMDIKATFSEISRRVWEGIIENKSQLYKFNASVRKKNVKLHIFKRSFLHIKTFYMILINKFCYLSACSSISGNICNECLTYFHGTNFPKVIQTSSLSTTMDIPIFSGTCIIRETVMLQKTL